MAGDLDNIIAAMARPDQKSIADKSQSITAKDERDPKSDLPLFRHSRPKGARVRFEPSE